MTEKVLQIQELGFGVGQYLKEAASNARTTIKSRSKVSSLVVLGIILAILQVLDGVLTGIGMQMYGTVAEGNILLKYLMDQMGYLPALILTKGLAICIIIWLCFLGSAVSWIENAFKLVILIYLGAAIIPWTLILVPNIL